MNAKLETKATVKSDIAKIMSVLGNELSDTIDVMNAQARSDGYQEARKDLQDTVNAIRANLHNPKIDDKDFRSLMSNLLYRLEGSAVPGNQRLQLAAS